MLLEENRNIMKLNDFCESFQNEIVVKSGLDEFKKVIRAIIFNGEEIQSGAIFFHERTRREKILFKDFLQIKDVSSLITNINRIDTLIRDITDQFMESIDKILLNGTCMDDILRENHGRSLKQSMLMRILDSVELQNSHSYLFSRLTDELKNELINNNSEFHKKVEKLLDELSSMLL